MEKQLYTTKEVAKILSVTTRTVRRWIDEGHLAAIKINRVYRIRKEVLDAFTS